MVITYLHTGRDESDRLASHVMGTMVLQTGSRWHEATRPTWEPQETPAWFDVVLPFLRQGSPMTWVQVWLRLGEPQAFAEGDPAAKLRAFHDWLDSIPPVPHIPLEALDRGNLY